MKGSCVSSPLIIEDLLNLHYPSEPQIHPDGSLIAYTTSSDFYDDKEQVPKYEVWMCRQGGESWQVTNPETCAFHPRWSPDGRYLAFLGIRGGKGRIQLFLLEHGWGEARLIAENEGSLGSFAWSPDGSRIALLIRDPEPEALRERKDAGRDHIEYEQDALVSRLWLYTLATGEMQPLTGPDMQVWEFVWSPDGQALAAIVSDSPHNWSWYRPRLVRVGVGGDDVATIHQPPKTITRPAWSPGGEQIAFITCAWSDQGMTGGDIVLLDCSTGSVQTITEGHPRSYTALEWDPDGRSMLANAVENARAVMCRVDTGGNCNILWDGDATISYYDSTVFTRAGNTLAMVRGDCASPGEVWLFHLDQRTWEQCTSMNPEIEGKQLHTVESRTWQSMDGMSIHGILVLPHGYDGATRLPLITLIHGGPSGVVGYEFPTHRTVGWAHLLANEGYAVLLPNFRGSMGFGTAFLEANLGDMGGGDMIDVLAGIDAMIAEGIADPDRLGVGGWSYGGYLTAWAITRSDRFKAAVAGAPITNWTSFHGTSTIQTYDEIFYTNLDPYNADGIYTFRSPVFSIRSARTPTLFLHGENDPICPVGQSHEMWRGLKDLGVDTSLVIYPREGHGPREREHVRDVLERMVAWFTRYV